MKEKKITILWSLAMVISLLLCAGGTGYAKVTGACVNCHTMHNSQDGVAMATFAGETGPNNALVRGSCLGCHGQVPAGANNIITNIPQVSHNDGDDLAGGNFSYITGDKALVTGDASTVGHNVIELSTNDATLTQPPGDEYTTGITNANFTCAGEFGCHGDRSESGSFAGVSGAHHAGVEGLCDTADTVANSYRFLLGVKGHENMDATYRWQNYNTQYHNEYLGITAATEAGSGTAPGGNTISGLCAECHGNFHGTADIGGDNAYPFSRHPTDIVLPDKTEYSAYTTYSVTAPVARVNITTVNTAGVNNVVAPGTDVVMCLSCHGVHGTAYEDILRWDYTGMIANSTGGDTTTGCFICHTTKDDV